MHKHTVGGHSCSTLQLVVEVATELSLCKKGCDMPGAATDAYVWVCDIIHTSGLHYSTIICSVQQSKAGIFLMAVLQDHYSSLYFFSNLCVISLSLPTTCATPQCAFARYHIICLSCDLLFFFPVNFPLLPATQAQAWTPRCTFNMAVLWKVKRTAGSVWVLVPHVCLQCGSAQRFELTLLLWACLNKWHVFHLMLLCLCLWG